MSLEGGKTWARQHADRVEAATPAAPTPEEGAEEITLQDALKDRAFGEMLAAEKDPELIELGARVRSNETVAGDIKELAKWHKEYIARGKRAEALGASIEQHFGKLKSSSPDLESISKFLSDEQFQLLMKTGWREIAYRDPKRFAQLEKKLGALTTAEKRIDDPNDPINKTLTDFCTKHKISSEALDTALQIQSVRDRGFAIRDLMRKEMSIFGKARDSWRMWKKQPSALDDAQAAARHKADLDAALADIATQMKSVGTLLGKTFSGNDEMREALTRALNENKPEFKDGIDSKLSYTEAQGRKIDTKHLSTAWHEYLDDNGITDFSTQPASMQDTHRNRFWRGVGSKKGYMREHLLKDSEKKGFWNTVLEFILSNKHTNDPKIKSILS